MKPCFRSLSCLLTVTALALLSTEAAARTDAKQPHVQEDARGEEDATMPRHRPRRLGPIAALRSKNAGTRNMPMRKTIEASEGRACRARRQRRR